MALRIQSSIRESQPKRAGDVSTWSGFVYVAFVIDAYARWVVGWRVSRTAQVSFVLDALEQARHELRPAHRGGLAQHSDRSAQYVSIRYSELLVEAGIEPAVGYVNESYQVCRCWDLGVVGLPTPDFPVAEGLEVK